MTALQVAKRWNNIKMTDQMTEHWNHTFAPEPEPHHGYPDGVPLSQIAAVEQAAAAAEQAAEQAAATEKKGATKKGATKKGPAAKKKPAEASESSSL